MLLLLRRIAKTHLILILVFNQPAFAKVLTGSIQINEQFPLLGPILSPSAQFGKSEAERIFGREPQSEWFQIPRKFAGTWKTTNNTRATFMKNEISGTSEEKTVLSPTMVCALGTEVDSRNQIWHHQRFPGLAMLDSPNFLPSSSSKTPTIQKTQTVVKPSELLFYVCFIHKPSGLEYNSASCAVAQEIQIESYKLVGDSEMQCTVVNRKFNINGEAISFEHTIRNYARVKAFEPDLTELSSFKEHLKDKGLHQLIPDGRFRSNSVDAY